MAINRSRPTPASSGKRIMLLLGTLAALGLIYFSLPKSWFEIPDTTTATSTGKAVSTPPRNSVPLRPTQSAPGENIVALQDAARQNPLDFGTRSRYGMALASAGRGREALEEFQAAARLAPESPGVHHNLGIYYLNTEQLQKAETEFCRELEIAPGDGRVHYYRGLIFQRQHKDKEAVAQLREAMALAPQLPDSYLTLAMQLTRSGDEAQVRSLADTYIRLHGDKALADYVLSGAYRTWKNYPEAIRYAEMTVQLASNNYGYWHNLGQVYSYAHRWDDADRALHRALELAHDPSTPLIELGMNAQDARRFEDAEKYYKSALVSSPKTGNIHLYLTHLYQKWNKEPEAHDEERLFRRWEIENNARLNSKGITASGTSQAH